jgi:hypothetical protein
MFSKMKIVTRYLIEMLTAVTEDTVLYTRASFIGAVLLYPTNHTHTPVTPLGAVPAQGFAPSARQKNEWNDLII